MSSVLLLGMSSSALVFHDVEPGAEVGDVAKRVLVDEYVGRVQHNRSVRARIDPFGRRRRHKGGQLLLPELILDGVDAQAGVLICGKYHLGADEAARPVLVDVVWPEMAPDLQIVLVRRRREGRDADRVGFDLIVEHPDWLEAVLLMVEHGLVDDDQRLRSDRGRALCVPPPNGGAHVLWTMSFGLALSLTSTTARQASRQLQ